MDGEGAWGMFSPHIKGGPRQSLRSLLTLFSGVVSLAGRESRRLKSNTLTLSRGRRLGLRLLATVTLSIEQTQLFLRKILTCAYYILLELLYANITYKIN